MTATTTKEKQSHKYYFKFHSFYLSFWFGNGIVYNEKPIRYRVFGDVSGQFSIHIDWGVLSGGGCSDRPEEDVMLCGRCQKKKKWNNKNTFNSIRQPCVLDCSTIVKLKIVSHLIFNAITLYIYEHCLDVMLTGLRAHKHAHMHNHNMPSVCASCAVCARCWWVSGRSTVWRWERERHKMSRNFTV